jgi:hypothetical protein
MTDVQRKMMVALEEQVHAIMNATKGEDGGNGSNSIMG